MVFVETHSEIPCVPFLPLPFFCLFPLLKFSSHVDLRLGNIEALEKREPGSKFYEFSGLGEGLEKREPGSKFYEFSGLGEGLEKREPEPGGYGRYYLSGLGEGLGKRE